MRYSFAATAQELHYWYLELFRGLHPCQSSWIFRALALKITFLVTSSPTEDGVFSEENLGVPTGPWVPRTDPSAPWFCHSLPGSQRGNVTSSEHPGAHHTQMPVPRWGWGWQICWDCSVTLYQGWWCLMAGNVQVGRQCPRVLWNCLLGGKGQWWWDLGIRWELNCCKHLGEGMRVRMPAWGDACARQNLALWLGRGEYGVQHTLTSAALPFFPLLEPWQRWTLGQRLLQVPPLQGQEQNLHQFKGGIPPIQAATGWLHSDSDHIWATSGGRFLPEDLLWEEGHHRVSQQQALGPPVLSCTWDCWLLGRVWLPGTQPYSRDPAWQAPDHLGLFLYFTIFAKPDFFWEELRRWGNRVCHAESAGSLTGKSCWLPGTVWDYEYCSVYFLFVSSQSLSKGQFYVRKECWGKNVFTMNNE